MNIDLSLLYYHVLSVIVDSQHQADFICSLCSFLLFVHHIIQSSVGISTLMVSGNCIDFNSTIHDDQRFASDNTLSAPAFIQYG